MADPISKTIPLGNDGVDLLRSGANSNNFATGTKELHPVDRIQRATKNSAPSPSSLNLDTIRRLYGSGLAMRLATECEMARKVGGRLPNLQSTPDSNLMYDIVTGNDMTIDFSDYLNVEQNRAAVEGVAQNANIGIHSAMEQKLNL